MKSVNIAATLKTNMVKSMKSDLANLFIFVSTLSPCLLLAASQIEKHTS